MNSLQTVNTCTQTRDIFERAKANKSVGPQSKQGVLVAELISREATSRQLFTMRAGMFSYQPEQTQSHVV